MTIAAHLISMTTYLPRYPDGRFARRIRSESNIALFFPRPTIDDLVDSPDKLDRLAAAQDRRTLDFQIAILSRDPEAEVRAAIARRDDLPSDVAEHLVAFDSDPQVRLAVVMHQQLDDYYLRAAARDIDPLVIDAANALLENRSRPLDPTESALESTHYTHGDPTP